MASSPFAVVKILIYTQILRYKVTKTESNFIFMVMHGYMTQILQWQLGAGF